MRQFALILSYSLCASAAFGQLYLMTGSPNPKGLGTYPSALWRVEDNGDVRMVGDYLVGPQVGTEWIGVSYDWRKAVLLSGYSQNKLVVVDFEKAAVVKRCKVPDSAGRSLMSSWLAEAAAPGPSYEWLETSTDVIRDAVVQGMVLNPAVPCESSFSKLEPEAIRYVIAHGQTGIADAGSWDGVHTNTGQGEMASVTTFTNRTVPLGYQVPSALLKGLRIAGQAMDVNDSHVFVITLTDGKDDFRVLVFRKSDKTWHTLPRVGDRYPYVRGFGRYLAATEVRAKSAQNPRSAGMEKWRAGSDGVRPDLRSSVAEMEQAFPGKLYLYDVDTERFFSITTDQGDSEVLLVENGIVYYRAADRLYFAPIGERGIGPARLLAEDEDVLDAHWAFIKR